MVALSRAALAEVDELVDTIVLLLVAAEPPGFYDDEGLEDLRVTCRLAISSVLAMLAGDDPAESALEIARVSGRRQVQQDLPLEGVLRAYRLAGRALWEHMVSSARAGGIPVGEALLDGATEVWRVIDLFCSAASEAYRSEEDLLRHRDDRVQAAVLGALLEGRGADPQFARDASGALGIKPDSDLICIVGLAEVPEELALDNARERLRLGGVTSVWLTLAGSDVGLIVVGHGGPGRIRQLLTPAVRTRAGMSPVFRSLAELPRAHRLAEIAALSDGNSKGIHILEDDLVAGLVVDSPLVAGMISDRTVGCLLAAEVSDGRELLATVRAFLEAEGSLQDAASKNFVHRNTMLYRLKKVEKLTGISVQSASGQVLWTLAIKELDTRSA